MSVRSEVRFSSRFPVDYVAGQDGGPDVAAGRNIASALKTALESCGYRVSDPMSGGDNGWELDIWRGGKRLWLQVSVLDAEECYIMAQNMTFFLWPDAKLFREFLSDLHRVLQADARFSRIGWLARGGIDRGDAPAAAPFDD